MLSRLTLILEGFNLKAERHCDRDSRIRDVYDGALYQRHYQSFLKEPGNISLILNTDGVAELNDLYHNGKDIHVA